MTRATKFLAWFAALVVVGMVSVWAAAPWANSPNTEHEAASSDRSVSGVLDGMTFRANMGLSDKPADVEDNLIFADGLFVSTECERNCGYPPAPYYVRHLDEKIEFIAQSTCDESDATMVWRGTIDNGMIEGRVQWTAKRWYWTVEKEFWFEGTLLEGARPVAGIE